MIATITQPCRGFAWMPDSRYLVVTRDTTRQHEIYDANTGLLVRQLEGSLAIGTPFVDRAGRRLMSVGNDASSNTVLHIWDLEAGTLMDGQEVVMGTISDPGAVRPALGGFWSAVVDPEGNRVALSGGLGSVRQWETHTRAQLAKLANRFAAEETLAYTADGRALYVSGQGKFGLYEADSSQVLAEFSGPTGAVAISPDQQRIVSCGDRVVIWDVPKEMPVLTLANGAPEKFVSVDWSADGKRIAASRSDGSVHIWTLAVGP